jgi:hypothetical protein
VRERKSARARERKSARARERESARVREHMSIIGCGLCVTKILIAVTSFVLSMRRDVRHRIDRLNNFLEKLPLKTMRRLILKITQNHT